MSLKIVNLSKRFNDRWVLRDISFEVSKGEIFGIAGASGAGKSTLLQAIAGRIRSNGGVISADGTPALYAVSGQPHVPIWKRLFGRAEVSRDNDALANLVERIENANGVLLLDDPFARMDRVSRHKAETAICSIRERGLPIVLASSEFEDVLGICDRAAILAGTELKQMGTPKELYENPETSVVASLTGRCNFFPARRLSSSKADIPEFHTIDGGHRVFARSIERGALGAINQNVTLGIRPEHISISFGASFPEDNLLRATITGVRFLGPTTLLDLDSSGLELQALVLRLVGLKVRDECVLGLPIDNVHIFKD